MKIQLWLVLLITIVFQAGSVSANSKLPAWCIEGQMYSEGDIEEIGESTTTFENAYNEYEKGNLVSAIVKFRKYAILHESSDAAYNTAYIAEKIRKENFYGGDYYISLCQKLKNNMDFYEGYSYFIKDDAENDSQAIKIFTELSKDGNSLASYFLSRIYSHNPLERVNKYNDLIKSIEYALISYEQGGVFSKNIITTFSGFAVINNCRADGFMSIGEIYSNRSSLAGLSDDCDRVLNVVSSYFEIYKSDDSCKKSKEMCNLLKALTTGSGGLKSFCAYAVEWYSLAAEKGHPDALERIIKIYSKSEKKNLLDNNTTCYSRNDTQKKKFSDIGMRYYPKNSFYTWSYGMASLGMNYPGNYENENLGSKYLREAALIDINNGNIDSAVSKYDFMVSIGLDNLYTEALENDLKKIL